MSPTNKKDPSCSVILLLCAWFSCTPVANASDAVLRYYLSGHAWSSDFKFFPMNAQRARLLSAIENGTVNVASPIGEEQTTPLMYAVQVGDIKMVKILLENGAAATINNHDKDHRSAFDYALSSNNIPPFAQTEIAKLMVKAGADVNLSSHANTPFWLAACHGDTLLVKLFHEAGGDPQDSYFHSNALHGAILVQEKAKEHNADPVGAARYLIEAGSDFMDIYNHNDGNYWEDPNLSFETKCRFSYKVPAARALVQQEQRKLLSQVLARLDLPSFFTECVAPFMAPGINYRGLTAEVNYRKDLQRQRDRLLAEDPYFAQELAEREQSRQKRKVLAGYNPDQFSEQKLELHHLAQHKLVSTGSDPKHFAEVGRYGRRWLTGFVLEKSLKERPDGVPPRVVASHARHQAEQEQAEQRRREQQRLISCGHLKKPKMIGDKNPLSTRRLPKFSGKYYRKDVIRPGEDWNQSEYSVDDID